MIVIQLYSDEYHNDNNHGDNDYHDGDYDDNGQRLPLSRIPRVATQTEAGDLR